MRLAGQRSGRLQEKTTHHPAVYFTSYFASGAVDGARRPVFWRKLRIKAAGDVNRKKRRSQLLQRKGNTKPLMARSQRFRRDARRKPEGDEHWGHPCRLKRCVKR
jgi:hypothetical protein